MVLHGRDVLLGRGPELNLIRRRQRLLRDQLLDLIQPSFELTVILGHDGNRAVIAGEMELIYQGRKQHLFFPGMVELVSIYAKKANEKIQVLRAALCVDELTHCSPKRIQHPVNQIMLGAQFLQQLHASIHFRTGTRLAGFNLTPSGTIPENSVKLAITAQILRVLTGFRPSASINAEFQSRLRVPDNGRFRPPLRRTNVPLLAEGELMPGYLPARP